MPQLYQSQVVGGQRSWTFPSAADTPKRPASWVLWGIMILWFSFFNLLNIEVLALKYGWKCSNIMCFVSGFLGESSVLLISGTTLFFIVPNPSALTERALSIRTEAWFV
jgi:hypothetical protein